MSVVGQIERKTQDRVVKLFRDQLGYEYAGNWDERADNSNVEEKFLRDNLVARGYDEEIIARAIHEFLTASSISA